MGRRFVACLPRSFGRGGLVGHRWARMSAVLNNERVAVVEPRGTTTYHPDGTSTFVAKGERLRGRAWSAPPERLRG